MVVANLAVATIHKLFLQWSILLEIPQSRCGAECVFINTCRSMLGYLWSSPMIELSKNPNYFVNLRNLSSTIGYPSPVHSDDRLQLYLCQPTNTYTIGEILYLCCVGQHWSADSEYHWWHRRLSQNYIYESCFFKLKGKFFFIHQDVWHFIFALAGIDLPDSQRWKCHGWHGRLKCCSRCQSIYSLENHNHM